MDTSLLAQYGRRIEHLLEANVPHRMQEGIEQAVERQDWELLGILSLTGSEISARRMVDAALEAQQYDVLALVACLRRQVRRPHADSPGRGTPRRVLRDLDEEEDTGGIPDYILADVREMKQAAEISREASLRRDAEQDRDPIREYIVESLGERLRTSDAAMEALVVVAKASGWESTRRRAAVKVANHQPSVQRLVTAGRSADLIALGKNAALHSVAANVGKALAQRLDDFASARDKAALQFVAENHPDREGKRAAREALRGLG